ncbi:MAG: hypothetical protein Q4A00_02365 [Flavobacteriaceae bacterium]|nr:hypothetical protein [Flavobacteriaceae bacterium]
MKEVFVEKIKERGFNVIDFHNEEFQMPQPDFLDKLKNIFYRKILNRKDYYECKIVEDFRKQSVKRIKNIDLNSVDYAVFFRADNYPEELIKSVKQKGIKMSSYQCDGISGKMKKILEYRPYFDDIFCFNPEDLTLYKDYQLKFLTNCFIDESVELKPTTRDRKELYYLGVASEERISNILNLNTALPKSKYKVRGHLTIPPFRAEKKIDDISLCHQAVEYKEYLENIKESDFIIDLVYPIHKGLSFRFFEGMYYQKKIITNNSDVRRYDFYKPENIFICDFKNFDGLEEFLETPYESIEEQVMTKYSINNWIDNMLNLPTKQEIVVKEL